MNFKRYTKIKSTKVWMVAVVVFSLVFSACEFELPEANSKPDATPPMADFSGSLGDDYLSYKFSNFSVSATDYSWDFGDGATSTSEEPEHTYAEMPTDEDEAGTSYMVTLTASDKLGVTSVVTKEVIVKKPEKPILIDPEVKNGDFTLKIENWRLTTYPFNTSSDGSPNDYDGVDTGAKTPGAKYTSGSSAGPDYLTDRTSVTSDTRFAYQPIAVSPNAEYIIEFEYANTSLDSFDNRMIVEILDGWYNDQDEINASTVPPLVQVVGDEELGKGNFTRVKTQFTSNDSGQIAIFFYAITQKDVWIDNIKVYPADI